MGVYIPNMSKPKDCYLCEFTNGYECWSNGEPWFDVKEAYAKRTLSPNCPLIEIGDIEYRAFKGFTKMLLTKIEDRILYGERRK